MQNFHPNFPFGKGVWIWYLDKCYQLFDRPGYKGTIDDVIKRLKDYGFSYVIVKAGDSIYTWDQFTPEMIKKFKDAGIKVYGWAFNYGENPEREAAIANWALDMGIDGFVFNAETAYENLPNNAAAAEKMLKIVREKHPTTFLAHAPYAIIKYHMKFPYATFGKYCDAVMPQMYWGTMKLSPAAVITATYDAFVKWEQQMRDQGKSDSIKPIIPVGQSYDNYEIKPNFVLTPKDLREFIAGVSGYMSINFWSLQHLIRPDCLEAIRDTPVKAPNAVETPPTASPNVPTPPSSAPVEVVPTPPAAPVVCEPVDTTAQKIAEPVKDPSPTPDKGLSNPIQPPISHKVPLPDGGQVTVTATRDKDNPGHIDVKIRHHIPHVLLVKAFFTSIFHVFSKGGDKK